jgi:hypothetical protein
VTAGQEEQVKSREEIMEILEAFDLTGSLRDAGELAGCSHHTVAAYVAKRDAGELPGEGPVRRVRILDGFLPKIEEWVERSQGKIRADVCYEKLVALGYDGSDRTVRRAVAEAKTAFRAGRRRVYRPWIAEPGMWAQWDWGTGPTIDGRCTNLFCAWLAWSRFRVVIPTWDKTLPTVIGCLDRAMRAFGGAPTYWLTDNERTVTMDHVAGIAVRHPQIVALGGHYGITVATCVPADPESKGGSEATVRIAKADLVPTDANLRDDYASWAELATACEAFEAEVNGRAHRVTRRVPDEMLAEERHRLHRLPERPYTTVLGETRKVSWSSTISFGGVTYSVPHQLVDDTVWVRVEGDDILDRLVTVATTTGEILRAAAWGVSSREGTGLLYLHRHGVGRPDGFGPDDDPRSLDEPGPIDVADYPATAVALEGGSFAATLDAGDSAERAFLAARGFAELIGAGARRDGCGWLVELAGDALSTPLSPHVGTLDALVELAVRGATRAHPLQRTERSTPTTLPMTRASWSPVSGIGS